MCFQNYLLFCRQIQTTPEVLVLWMLQILWKSLDYKTKFFLRYYESTKHIQRLHLTMLCLLTFYIKGLELMLSYWKVYIQNCKRFKPYLIYCKWISYFRYKHLILASGDDVCFCYFYIHFTFSTMYLVPLNCAHVSDLGYVWPVGQGLPGEARLLCGPQAHLSGPEWPRAGYQQTHHGHSTTQPGQRSFHTC